MAIKRPPDLRGVAQGSYLSLRQAPYARVCLSDACKRKSRSFHFIWRLWQILCYVFIRRSSCPRWLCRRRHAFGNISFRRGRQRYYKKRERLCGHLETVQHSCAQRNTSRLKSAMAGSHVLKILAMPVAAVSIPYTLTGTAATLMRHRGTTCLLPGAYPFRPYNEGWKNLQQRNMRIGASFFVLYISRGYQSQ